MEKYNSYSFLHVGQASWGGLGLVSIQGLSLHRIKEHSKPCSDTSISKGNAGVCGGPDLCEEPVSHTRLAGGPRWGKAQFLNPGILLLEAAVTAEALLEQLKPRGGSAWPEHLTPCQHRSWYLTLTASPPEAGLPVVTYYHPRQLLSTSLAVLDWLHRRELHCIWCCCNKCCDYFNIMMYDLHIQSDTVINKEN